MLSAGLLLAVLATAIAVAGSGHKAATGGDPFRLTANRLQGRLAGSEAKVRSEVRREGRVRSVVGIGSVRGLQIGFEFQLFASSDEATVRGLGKLDASDFGWAAKYRGVYLPVRIRGVLANVAYATYQRLPLAEEDLYPGSSLQYEFARNKTIRALDEALFRSFPSADRYANALSARP